MELIKSLEAAVAEKQQEVNRLVQESESNSSQYASKISAEIQKCESKWKALLHADKMRFENGLLQKENEIKQLKSEVARSI